MSRLLELDYKRMSDLPLELTGAACAGAALLVLMCLCWRTRLRRRQLRTAGPPLLGDQLPEPHRARLLELQFYLRSCLQYRAVRLLPQVAARDDVALALVEPDDDDLRDEAARSSGLCSTVVRSLCGREPDAYVLTMFPCAHAHFLHDTRDLVTLQRLLLGPPGEPVHPRLLRMRSFEFLPASGMVAGVRRWSAAGSLRDLIHGVSPEGAHRLKYGRVGVPLSETKCCTYGYHLLQALRALAPLGSWTAAHAHCGNLFVTSNQQLVLAEWEGGAFGLASPIAAYVEALAPTMEPAVAALAHALYEMACGFEGDAPRPSVFPPACPPALLQTLQHLFRPPALAKLPLSLDAVAEMPFFQRVAPRRPGAADAPLPGPDRASRALLIKMGLLSSEHRSSRADSAASGVGSSHQHGDAGGGVGGGGAAASTRSTRRRSSRSAAQNHHSSAVESATDDLELGGRVVATTELTESGYEDPSLHGESSAAHRLE